MCTDSGASDLDVAIPTGQLTNGKWVVKVKETRAYWGAKTPNVCDAMVLFTIGANDVRVSLGSGEQSIPLRNVRVASVVRKSTNPSGANKHPVRFGSGAFCVWAAEPGYNQSYDVTVQAFDPEGNLHEGTAAVEIDCTTTSEGATSQTTFYPNNLNGTTDNPDYCAESTACVASVELPETCSGQCQCDPDSGGSGGGGSDGGSDEECIPSGENYCGGDSGGGGSGGGGSDGGSEEECIPSGENYCGDDSGVDGSEGAGSGEGSSAENDALTGASTQAIKGGCAAFPGAGADLGVSVLAMLGISVALRRRR
ncbi:MAG: hypothetical protein A2V77_11725 [Anaeromyxobacter sp. RBG_16_69_14]|nr:MAG: hypothetical protein A2V77_11725 [Anaeromyxobacter sp. RBG_16_69_14]